MPNPPSKSVKRRLTQQKAKPEWVDSTSYSQRDEERIPNAWCLDLHDLQIVVHRHIHYPPDVWLITCHNIGIQAKPLQSENVEEAQKEAVWLVEDRLQGWLRKIKDYLAGLLNA